MARTVAGPFAEILAATGIKRIYGVAIPVRLYRDRRRGRDPAGLKYQAA